MVGRKFRESCVDGCGGLFDFMRIDPSNFSIEFQYSPAMVRRVDLRAKILIQ